MIEGPSDELVIIDGKGNKTEITDMADYNFCVFKDNTHLIYQPSIFISDYNTIKSKTLQIHNIITGKTKFIELDLPMILTLDNEVFYYSKIDSININKKNDTFILIILYGNSKNQPYGDYECIKQIAKIDSTGKNFKIISTDIDCKNTKRYEILDVDKNDNLLYSIDDSSSVKYFLYDLKSGSTKQIIYKDEFFTMDKLAVLTKNKNFIPINIYKDNSVVYLALFDKSNNEIKNLISYYNSWACNVALSPDSKFIAFTREISERYLDIFLIEVKTKKIWQVTRPRTIWSKIIRSSTPFYKVQWGRKE